MGNADGVRLGEGVGITDGLKDGLWVVGRLVGAGDGTVDGM